MKRKSARGELKEKLAKQLNWASKTFEVAWAQLVKDGVVADVESGDEEFNELVRVAKDSRRRADLSIRAAAEVPAGGLSGPVLAVYPE